MSIAVSPPERCRGGSAVHALPTLCKEDRSQIFLDFEVFFCCLVQAETVSWKAQSRKGEITLLSPPPEEKKDRKSCEVEIGEIEAGEIGSRGSSSGRHFVLSLIL